MATPFSYPPKFRFRSAAQRVRVTMSARRRFFPFLPEKEEWPRCQPPVVEKGKVESRVQK